ncbi:MAG: phosphate/phosphoenolpyruvate translocator protein [Monoraphidium minutum]|nr:MAG: phosphate/phosphoenolpyruvate translocator protein [Monoraphidium minutum]
MAPAAPSNAFVYGCIGAWIANSALCVLTNKHILFYLRFSFPSTLAVMHMCSAFCVAAALVHGTPDGRRHLPAPGTAPPSFFAQLGGIAALFGAVLVLSNSAFMYLSVPSIQMLKASGAATTFLVGLAFGNEAYSNSSMLKVGIVGLGVVIASYGDIRANLLGVSLQVSAILSDAVRCNLLQKVMQKNAVELTPVGTLYYVAPMAAAALALPAVMLDGAKLRVHDAPVPWAWLVLSCLAASSLNLVVFTLIGKTSALTTSITGPLKEWVCILASVMVYGSKVTGQQWMGYAIALVGILWYQRDKFFSGQKPSEDEAADGAAAKRGAPDEKTPLVQRAKPGAEPEV